CRKRQCCAKCSRASNACWIAAPTPPPRKRPPSHEEDLAREEDARPRLAGAWHAVPRARRQLHDRRRRAGRRTLAGAARHGPARGGDAGQVAEDGLHPSGAMYTTWTQLALPVARTLMAK